MLQETADRVSAMESLGRTRELVAKDLVLNGTYRIGTDDKGNFTIAIDQAEEKEGEDEDRVTLDREYKFWSDTRIER